MIDLCAFFLLVFVCGFCARAFPGDDDAGVHATEATDEDGRGTTPVTGFTEVRRYVFEID